MTLSDYLLKVSPQRYSVGKLDCVLFTAGWVKEATGRDVLAGVPTWHNKTRAQRLLALRGGLELAVMEKLGQPRAGGFEDGDIAYMREPDSCLGIVVGASVAVITEEGLGILSVSDAKHIWSIKNV